jgi:hypothetical protein
VALARALTGDWIVITSVISATRQMLERRKLNNFLIPLRPTIPARRNQMVAGIFSTKKRAACFATLRAQRKGVVPAVNGIRDPAERRRQSRLCPPTLNGSKYPRRFETGRPPRAVAPSNYPSSCYGLAGGAAAGDASAPGDAMPLSLLAADDLW